jgi:hypothetical protein
VEVGDVGIGDGDAEGAEVHFGLLKQGFFFF